MRTEIRLLAPTGNLGSGYSIESFKRGLEFDPHIICCDSGSTDGGPSSLGSGKPYFPRPLYLRDLSHLIIGARERKIPLIIGSAAGAGTDVGVDFLAEIVQEIARSHSLIFRLAKIYSQQSVEYLVGKNKEGKCKPLWPSGELDEDTVRRAERVVGMMGCEPLVAALDAGADVIIAGRASDTALFAALPTLHSFPPGPAWHAGKILECGAAAAVKRLFPDCMVASVRRDHFVVSPVHPEMRCSPLSVAAHTLYENSDPYRMKEPSGTLLTKECVYEQEDDRAVRVTGSDFEPADPFTIKLEAAEKIGFHSVAVAGVRDPFVVNNIRGFLDSVKQRAAAKVRDSLGLTPDDYTFVCRIYGLDAVMGSAEPIQKPAHEVGLLFEALASTQEQANAVLATYRYVALHNPVPEWDGMVTNLAHAHSPTTMERGLAYQFSMNHVVEPDTPTEMFRTVISDV